MCKRAVENNPLRTGDAGVEQGWETGVREGFQGNYWSPFIIQF